MSKSDMVIPKEIVRLDQAIRAGKPLEPKKLHDVSAARARSEPIGKSTYAGVGDGGFKRIAENKAAFVGQSRFAASARSIVENSSLAERAATLVERLPRDKRGQYLAHVVKSVFKVEEPKLNFRKDE